MMLVYTGGFGLRDSRFRLRASALLVENTHGKREEGPKQGDFKPTVEQQPQRQEIAVSFSCI